MLGLDQGTIEDQGICNRYGCWRRGQGGHGSSNKYQLKVDGREHLATVEERIVPSDEVEVVEARTHL